jgi:hypothetical protein
LEKDLENLKERIKGKTEANGQLKKEIDSNEFAISDLHN